MKKKIEVIDGLHWAKAILTLKGMAPMQKRGFSWRDMSYKMDVVVVHILTKLS